MVGGFGTFLSAFCLASNLTRDLSRYVPMVIRSPADPHLIIFQPFAHHFVCIELPIKSYCLLNCLLDCLLNPLFNPIAYWIAYWLLVDLPNILSFDLPNILGFEFPKIRSPGSRGSRDLLRMFGRSKLRMFGRSTRSQ